MQRKSFSRSAQKRDDPHERFLTIGLPQPHEGVGNALRMTFRASRDTLPDDMMQLLDQLDRH
ncbi:MAG TPA: hypothetical protein VJM09_11230 [Sphingobium sp.]|nr:hypothetical protein [Sphingobium sp.]